MIRHRITIPITPVAKAPWITQARCAGRDVNRFYGDSKEATPAEQIEAAIYFCGSCPVKDDCLADAERREERFGVWGGKDFADRTKPAATYPVHTHEDAAALPEQVADLHAQGFNGVAIAKQLGYSETRIRRIRRELRLPAHPWARRA